MLTNRNKSYLKYRIVNLTVTFILSQNHKASIHQTILRTRYLTLTIFCDIDSATYFWVILNL